MAFWRTCSGTVPPPSWLESFVQSLWELSRHALRRQTGQVSELPRPTTDKADVAFVLLEDTGRCGWGGLGAKVFNGLEGSRGAVCLDVAASDISALSGEVGMSFQGSHKDIRQRYAGVCYYGRHVRQPVILAPCLVPGAPRAEVCESLNAWATNWCLLLCNDGLFGATLKGVAFSNFPALSRAFGFCGYVFSLTRSILKTADAQHWTFGKKLAIESALEFPSENLVTTLRQCYDGTREAPTGPAQVPQIRHGEWGRGAIFGANLTLKMAKHCVRASEGSPPNY
jgi:hypothetical protein